MSPKGGFVRSSKHLGTFFLVPEVNAHTYRQLNCTIFHRPLPSRIGGMKLFGRLNGPTFPVIQSRSERKSSEDL